jgi:tRNA threonylcarbamoyladenosine biosynthesis protein TsaE
MKTYKYSLDELGFLVDEVLSSFKSGVIILSGDLASGKTTFVKELVMRLGLDDEVTSPTFSLQHCYGDSVFHYDIYNHGVDHFISLGMLEELEKDGLHLIEWGDDTLIDILKSAGIEILKIEIKKLSQKNREYRIDYA